MVIRDLFNPNGLYLATMQFLSTKKGVMYERSK